MSPDRSWQLMARDATGPVDWSTPEGIADAARRFEAMAAAAEECAAICRRLARILNQDPDDPPERKPVS